MRKKRPYLFREGYMGMGPVNIAPGNLVVVLMGAQVPFVLRPKGDPGHFEFLEEAYCDDIMDGEIAEKRSSQVFVQWRPAVYN